MRHAYAIGAAVLVSAVGCKAADEQKPPAPITSKASTPSTAAIPSAAPAAASTAVKLGAAPNLLDLVPARVAVSSTVVNPHDFPEFIVDGKMDTAWNGKTGDLVGGFIAFRVPRDAHVKGIEMTAGYDRVKGSVDLFTANHRIAKVQISRDGAVLGERALDPNVRGLQTVAVDGPGGDYEIKVLATLPGTKKEWKELTVSEFRVVGDPGKERRTAEQPLRVVVGKLDDTANGMSDYELADIAEPASRDAAALCRDYVKRLDATKAEREDTAKTNNLKLGTPSCSDAPLGVAFAGDATYKSALLVHTFDGLRKSVHVAVELARGFVITPIGWTTDDPTDPGCPSIVRPEGLEVLRIENGHLLGLLDGTRGFMDANGKFFSAHVRDATWCKDANSKLSCKWYMAMYRPPLTQFAIAPNGTLRLQGSAAESTP
jgi:hypothetical protein